MPVMVMVMLVIRDSGVDLLPGDGEDFQGESRDGSDDGDGVGDGDSDGDGGIDLFPCDGEDFQGKCGDGSDDEGRVKDGQHGQHLEVTKLDEIVQMVLENVKFA